jgi:predicted exporter
VLDKLYLSISDFVRNNKKSIFLFVGVINIVGMIGLFFVKYDNNIEVMLPVDANITRSLTFLKDSNLSNKIVISLSLTSPSKTPKDLFLAVDQLVDSFSPSLFTDVTVGFSEPDMIENTGFFLDNISQVVNKNDLSYLDGLINQDNISRSIRKIYRQMLSPGGLLLNPFMRSDPLGVKLLVLKKLKVLSESMGYDVSVENGHFISKDGRHSMIIAQTPVSVTDMFGAKKLFEILDGHFRQLPNYVSARIISGHSHTLSNERIMRRDIFLCSVITVVAFLILFVVVIRDIRAILILLIPLSSVVLSINISYLILGKLSYLVIGLGTVIAGISVDYAIHVYVAVRKGKDAFAAVRNVFAPVFAGSITTIATCSAFFFLTSRDITNLLPSRS